MLLYFLKNLLENGISTEIYSLINNEEVRPSTNLVVSKCSAYDYLNNVSPNIEKLATKYYDTFSIANRFTGYISNITIGNFYNDFSADTCDSTAILGGLNATARAEEESGESSGDSSKSNSSESSGDSGKESGSSSQSETSNSSSSNKDSQNQEDENVVTNPENLVAGTSSVIGKASTENIGIAVFNQDKFCGELTAMESICHLLITNDVDSCIVSIDSPVSEGEKMELQLYPSKKAKTTVNIKDEILNISINIKVDADILTLEDKINYESDEILEKISTSTENYLKEELNHYLNKVSKEFNSDIDCFSSKALAHFLTIPEWRDFNWREKYKNAEFNVDVDVNVISSLLVTKT